MALVSPYSGLKSPIPNEYNIGHLLIYDLSSKEYLLKETDALVLHGKKKYVTLENLGILEKKVQSQF